VSVGDKAIDNFLMDFVHLKVRFEPALRNQQFSDVIKHEVKAASLRRDMRNLTSRDTRRRAMTFMDGVLKLLEQYHCRIMGRVLIKRAAEMYTNSGHCRVCSGAPCRVSGWTTTHVSRVA